MKRCPGCNTPNPDNAKRCFKCRADLAGVEISVAEAPEKEENRKAEFMRIMSEAASGLRKRLLFAARNRTRVVFILTLIALAGLLPSVKWGFGIKLAAVCLGLVFTVAFASFERLISALEGIRRDRLASLLKNREKQDE